MIRIVFLGLLLVATTSVATAQTSSTPVAPACGSAPAEALSYTLKGADLGRRSTARAPADLFVAVPDSVLRPVEDSAICLELMMRITLVEPDAGDRPMVGVVRVGDAGHTVVLAPAPGDAEREGWINLYQLDFEGVLRMKRTINFAALAPPTCGSAPTTARTSVGGMVYGMGLRGGDGTPWDELLGTPQPEIVAVNDPARCTAIVRALQSNDPLPLLGIVRAGDRGLVVVRGTPPATLDGPSELSYAYLAPDLTLRAFRRIKS